MADLEEKFRFRQIVSYPDPSRKNREGTWQHILHCCVHAHCTVHTNQVTEFKSVTLINNVLTKQWQLDKALDVARVRVDSEESLPNKKKLEAFISVFVYLAAGYRKSFCHGYLPLYLTVCTVQYSQLMG